MDDVQINQDQGACQSTNILTYQRRNRLAERFRHAFSPSRKAFLNNPNSISYKIIQLFPFSCRESFLHRHEITTSVAQSQCPPPLHTHAGDNPCSREDRDRFNQPLRVSLSVPESVVTRQQSAAVTRPANRRQQLQLLRTEHLVSLPESVITQHSCALT